MLKVLEEQIETLRLLGRDEQERAALVLSAWLHGASELERADA
jgi:hypothetical protein